MPSSCIRRWPGAVNFDLALVLASAFGFLAAGCSTPHSLQLATTVGAQHTEVAVESAVQRLPRALGGGPAGAALDPAKFPPAVVER